MGTAGQYSEQEIREAITAANIALISLGEAERKLDKAVDWGIWDMLGGGLFSTMFKHSRIDEAKDAINESKRQLKRLKKEMADVSMPEEVHLEIDGMLAFADYFFDGVIADYLVQRKMNQAKQQIAEAKLKVQAIQKKLYQLLEMCSN